MKTKTGRKSWERITINVTPELAAKIKRAAERDDRSVSRFAGKVLVEHIANLERGGKIDGEKNE